VSFIPSFSLWWDGLEILFVFPPCFGSELVFFFLVIFFPYAYICGPFAAFQKNPRASSPFDQLSFGFFPFPGF